MLTGHIHSSALEVALKQADQNIDKNREAGRLKKRRLPLGVKLLFLAALCFGGMELAFCRLFSPALYKQITDPIVQPVVAAATAVKDQVIATRDAIDLQIRVWQATRRRDELLDRVLAGGEAYLDPEPIPLPELPQVADAPLGLDAPDPAGEAVTHFREEDGATILTGGSVPCIYYNQGDEAWRDKPYGGDPIGPYGCGPTAMSIVVSSLTQQPMDPAQMAAWAAEQGYWCPGSGSYLQIVEGAAKAFSLDCVNAKDCDAKTLYQRLSGGSMAVALVGPGHFTTSGHFIVLHGATLSGDVLVADPNSRENSLAAWDPQLILDEAAASSGDGVHLWLISAKLTL